MKIPLRDGVKLNATVYRPHEQKEPLPVVFTFTPYVGDSYTDRAMYFASHGFVKLTLWLKMDVPDTDLGADFYEILPDGSSILLTNATMGARYRDSLREPKPAAGEGGKIRVRQFHVFLAAGGEGQPVAAGGA